MPVSGSRRSTRSRARTAARSSCAGRRWGSARSDPGHRHAAERRRLPRARPQLGRQEEVYAALRGSARDADRRREPTLDPDTLISVKAGTKRKVFTGHDGVRMLVIGGVPGQVYEAPANTELGAAA